MMEIIIASDMEREELFAEIYFKDVQWAEVIFDQQKGYFQIEVFPPKDGGSWVFGLSEMQEALVEAKKRLINLGYSEV